HLTVATMSDSRVLSLFTETLKEIFDARAWMALWPAEERRHVLKVHRAIADAIFERRGNDAESLMRSHMLEYRDRLIRENPAVLKERVTWM
ncbi:MAG TPA: FCD domain-containing protein, partial [Jatrophihabitantaceae bacterium]|nr:FCD domain-containing protein [Jatrophihabitantaceae bacterium]